MQNSLREMTIVEARNKLTQLPEQLGSGEAASAVAVTRRGKPVLAVMSYDLYESITETLEVMADPQLMAELRHSIREADEDQTISWDNVKKELKL